MCCGQAQARGLELHLTSIELPVDELLTRMVRDHYMSDQSWPEMFRYI